MKRFLKTVPKLIVTPALVTGMAAITLYLLGTVPDYINPPESGYRQYSSLEDAEAYLGFKVVVPTYFPSYLAWPPVEVYGQREPVPMVQMLFVSQHGSVETMVISQIASDSEDPPVAFPWVRTVAKETPVSIGNSDGMMVTGFRADGQPVTGAYWRSGGFYFVVVTTRSERELLTIVRSM